MVYYYIFFTYLFKINFLIIDNSKMDVKICLWNDKIDCLDEK